MSSSSVEKRSRQEPGSACEQCRKRKLRCDRKQPKCSLCAENGEQCIVTGSHKRGPKAGHMKALMARLSAVEERLTSERNGNAPEATVASVDATTAPAEDPDLAFSAWVWSDNDDFGPGMMHHAGLDGSNTSAGPALDADDVMNDINGELSTQPQTTAPQALMQVARIANAPTLTTCTSPSLAAPFLPPSAAMHINTSPLATPRSMDMTSSLSVINTVQSLPNGAVALLPDLHYADRDQLYFDRVDECIPIIHEQSYHCWSNNANKSEQQICLQQSMWALAISSSSHPIAVANALYIDTRRRLQELESVGHSHDLLDLMQAQAWLLISVYEFVRVGFQRGWMSAGRAFRRIQLMKLHELDRIDAHVVSTSSASEWVQKEERRRTFWFAYALDRFVSLSNGSPPTLSEDADVRLPAPEMNFQSDQPVVMRFLSDALHNADDIGNDPLTEFVIAATVCGWAYLHRQQAMTSRAYVNPVQAFWERHAQIDRVLAPRIAIMSVHQPAMPRHIKPILLFTHLMIQTMTIYVHRIILDCHVFHDESHQEMVDATSRNFSGAVTHMANSSIILSQMSCFKAHTFCPLALAISIECLNASKENGGDFMEQTRMMSIALENLRRINILGGDHSVSGTTH